MLLEKDKYCCCPNCGCKTFEEIHHVNVCMTKNEWNDMFPVPYREADRYKCTRCGKKYSGKELAENWKQG